MAQFNFTKKLDIDETQIEQTDVMTGDNNRNRYLYYQLKLSMLHAKKIDIIVSFLMESGVRLILNDLKTALDWGVQIRILTGNYLGISGKRKQQRSIQLCRVLSAEHIRGNTFRDIP